MNEKVLYISGPMAGLPDHNRPAFFEAEKELQAAGYVVLNPAKNPDGLTRAQYLDIDLAMVRASDGVAVLSGFKNSLGARAEIALAISNGLPVLSVGGWITMEELEQCQ